MQTATAEEGVSNPPIEQFTADGTLSIPFDSPERCRMQTLMRMRRTVMRFSKGILYATAWAGATAEQKDAALVFATRLIDSQFQFRGAKSKAEEALQWPRVNCPDPDRGRWGVVALDVVPKAVADATCEMARELLLLDRTAAPPGEGLNITTSVLSRSATAKPMCDRSSRT